MSQINSNVQLLTLLVDSEDQEDSEYRFLVDGRDVKYVTVAPISLPRDDRTFAPILIPLLPPFPPGDWNVGHIAKDSATGQLEFACYEKIELNGITDTWHPTTIDFLELKKLDRLRQNVQRVSHPLFDTPVIFKFAEFDWQMSYFKAETAAYKWIEGTGIGPAFLGHVTEAGRVIGWVMEDLAPAQTAEPDDLEACQRVLRQLHALGIKHGDINRFNFLVRGDKARLVDFEVAEECNDVKELEEEYERLSESLNDPSFRGGVGPAVVSERLP
jgi:Lipopolysaccharide kinase (Kdo/WaaP) family